MSFKSIVVCFFCVVICQGAVFAEFKCGSAIVDITPTKLPLRLRGSFVPRETETVHDPLTVRCMVFDDGAMKVAVAVVDSCMVHRQELDRAKRLAETACGIPVNRIMISSTHTHSAPFANAQYGTPEELAYQEQLVEGIAEAIKAANDNLQPAKCGYGGRDRRDEVFNRRWFLKPGTVPTNPFGKDTDIVKMNPGRGPDLINPAGPVDPEVSIVSVLTSKGKPLAMLANYSLHYVGNTGGEISADYFGEFARLMQVRLRQKTDSGFVAMMSNGTSGDINNINFVERRPPREPYEQIRVVAGKVADTAYRAYRDLDYSSDIKLGMVEREVTLKLRIPTEEDISRSEAYLAKAAEDEKSVPLLARIYAQRVLDQTKLGETTKVKIQALRIGDLAICSLPFEVLVEIGLELKQKSPFNDTFVISIANGGFGYLPTRGQHAFGGYETWMCTNKVEIDSAEILTGALIEMMNELKD